MNVKLFTVIDSVAYVWADKGVTSFEAGCAVVQVTKQLGYPAPFDTGIWPNDLPGLFRLVAARLRLETGGGK